MPERTETVRAVVHYSASDLLHATEQHMRLREREANVILPHALKTRAIERGSHPSTPLAEQVPFWNQAYAVEDREYDSSNTTDSSHSSADTPITPRQFWISLWTFGSTSTTPILDFVLSCTASAVDDLPIFIYSNHPTWTLSTAFLAPRLSLLAEKLTSLIPVTRVFSVFAASLVTKEFAKAWNEETGTEIESKAYYEAALTFVTAKTLQPPVARATSSGLPQLPYTLRAATSADIEEVAHQCKVFADDSITFPLSKPEARIEASTYINAKQVYVCEVEDPETGVRELASIVAVTRNTEHSATITKVHTSAHHRRRGYAEILVRAVCASLLGRYESIALYVAHENIAAATVYDRVGFEGLLGKARPEGVEDWLELGFVGAIKGFW